MRDTVAESVPLVSPITGTPAQAVAPRLLWRDDNQPPADVEVVEIDGVPYALYLRAKGDTLQPRLAPLT